MREMLTFDDVVIVPRFSEVASRKDVDLSQNFYWLGTGVTLPVISSNMDTISESKMCTAMAEYGGIGCLHRFYSIEKNLEEFNTVFKNSNFRPMVSLGLGGKELERAEALHSAGAVSLVIDVAHGASLEVAKQAKALREIVKDNAAITVGNFATGESIKHFLEYVGLDVVNVVKVGIGSGSACSTRVQTGVGIPQFSAVLDVVQTLKNTGIATISDGGIRHTSDIAKALGAGASMVMIGGMLAGTDETPGEIVWKGESDRYYSEEEYFPKKMNSDGSYSINREIEFESRLPAYKKYRGSASKESYAVQNKDATWRTAEGESFLVPHKGPVKNVLQNIEGGLRSSFSYVGARDFKEFRSKVEFVKVTHSGYIEGTPHGKK